MLIDCHTHMRPYSFDARQSLAELLASLDSSGLSGVYATDHYEKDIFYVAGKEDIFSPDEYFTELTPIRQANFDKPPAFLIGIELGYLPHLDDYYAQLVPRYPFDAVILSLHILDGEDPYVDARMFGKGKAVIYGRYLEQLRLMARSCPNFDILGHFDYITRYGTYPDRKMYYRELPQAFDQLFEVLIADRKTLEINTRTIIKLQSVGYEGLDAWPDPEIIRRYLQMGGERLCLGSDAHKPGEAGCLLQETADWLRQLGCKTLIHYIGRQPVVTAL